jgi:23S rRNA (uracil1939-C5)-methyltransferase
MECPYSRCPGCSLKARAYSEQLDLKKLRIIEAFQRYPQLALMAPDVQPAVRTEGYRHRLKLPVFHTKNGPMVGLSDPKTRQVLNTPDCPVLEPRLKAALAQVQRWLKGRKEVSSVDLRVSNATGEIQALFSCVAGRLDMRAAKELLQQGIASISVSTADPEGRKVMGSRPKLLLGKATIEEQIGPTRYQLHPGAFFQVDPQNASWIHNQLSWLLKGRKRILDLYSGVGAYARRLALEGAEVVAVESVYAAVASARQDAPASLTVLQGDAADIQKLGAFDAVILNPAREGATPEVLARVARLGAGVAYVSCSPENLARDLDILAAFGLRVRWMGALDLFPQTPEVETVVWLTPGAKLVGWSVVGGRAKGPWEDGISGAIGRESRVLALVLGQRHPGRLLRTVAGHSLVEVDRLSALKGWKIAGSDPATAAFFAEKAGLVRPFLHVLEAGGVKAPLHGDLVWALDILDG